MKRFCLALDLQDDPALIKEYERLHRKENERPVITKSIRDAGITGMQIFRTGNRLFMIMETTDDFDFAKKQSADEANPDVVEWENHVWKFQKPLPWAKEGEKWILMEKIYDLPE